MEMGRGMIGKGMGIRKKRMNREKYEIHEKEDGAGEKNR